MSNDNTPKAQFNDDGSVEMCCNPGEHNFQARYKNTENEQILLYEICTACGFKLKAAQ